MDLRELENQQRGDRSLKQEERANVLSVMTDELILRERERECVCMCVFDGGMVTEGGIEQRDKEQ